MHKSDNIFFTIGPSGLYPTVRNHIIEGLDKNIPSLSHRSPEYQEFTAHTKQSLKKLLGIPDTHKIFFLGSATEGMERIVQNTVQKKCTVFANGVFSKRFYETAEGYRKDTQLIEKGSGEGWTTESIKSIDIVKTTELVAFTHNESSSGVQTVPEVIYSIAAKHPEALISVDIVSSAPYVKLDYSKIDMVFLSVQKGFGLPAGLGVLVVNERAHKKSIHLQEKGLPVGHYHNFPQLFKYEEKNFNPETPNVFGIYLLGKVCDDMLEYGIDRIRKETEEKADLIYSALDNSPFLDIAVSDPVLRSKTIIVANTSSNSLDLIAKIKERGINVSTGYGKSKEKQIRIGNLPARSLADTKKLITAIESL